MAETENTSTEAASARIESLSQIRKRHVFGPAIRQLYQLYDVDESKTLDAAEIRQMMLKT